MTHKILSEGEKQVLLWLGARLEKEPSGTIESTGLAEQATKEGAVNTMNTFFAVLSKIKNRGLVDTARGHRVSLYSLTDQGKSAYKKILSEGDKKKMASETIGEQLSKMGVSVNTYVAPAGITLPKKGAYTEDAKGIIALYKDRINGRASTNEIERLNEWFTKLTAEGRPAFEWIQEAICRTSTKVKSEQRTISYMIGILKSWGTYGYGTDYSAEQRKLFTLFEERLDCFLSEQSRQKLILLIDKYGLVDTMTSLFGTTKEDVDRSMLYLLKMEESLIPEAE